MATVEKRERDGGTVYRVKIRLREKGSENIF